MAHVRERTTVDLEDPVLVEGLPGVGLVGKIATDHLVEQYDMTFAASVEADGLPEVAVYAEDEYDTLPPVRLYADEERDLLALQSDVPVNRRAASAFADRVTEWIAHENATPLYLSGTPVQNDDPSHVPEVFGVATGGGGALLDANDIDSPPERGLVGGPTGALLNRAGAHGLDGVGLVVESDPQFPDPAAAKQLLERGVDPIAGVDAATGDLVEQAEQIRAQKQRLAEQMGQADEAESTQAGSMRMFE